MAELTFKQYHSEQPDYPHESATDRVYYDLCVRLVDIWRESGLLADVPDMVKGRVMICLTGYLQDVIADAGLWHMFTDWCRERYGEPVPFFKAGEEYDDYELNLIDVRFMLWYALAMTDGHYRFVSPHDPRLLNLGRLVYDEMERRYEELPMPEDYVFDREFDKTDPEDLQGILEMGHWMFMHSWLLTPAYIATYSQIADSLGPNADPRALRERLEESMNEDPTGPLALYLGEWVDMVITGKTPKEKPEKDDAQDEHPFHAAVAKAYGGAEIVYLKGYEGVDRFFRDVIGWPDGAARLPHFKGRHDFVVMTHRTRGMLMAVDVARCIADPANPLYDQAYASEHALDLLTIRGLCPPDLRKKILAEGWLVNAHFKGSGDTALVTDNADFIARCYLGKYYRGD